METMASEVTGGGMFFGGIVIIGLLYGLYRLGVKNGWWPKL